MLPALSALSMPGLSGAIGGGGGGLSSSTSATSSIGPTTVNPNVESGAGARGFSNVVAFPGSRIDGDWSTNQPTGVLPSVSPTIMIVGIAAFFLFFVILTLRR